jgi:hypothetical protein
MTSISVVLLPARDRNLVDATLASVRSQGVDDLRILDLQAFDGTSLPDTDFVAFARAGDRFLPGKLRRQMEALVDQPDVAFCYTAYRRVGNGQTGPLLALNHKLDVSTLLLRAPIEASTVVARTRALPDDALALLARPAGDVVLLAEVASHRKLLSLEEVLAEVALDPLRHGLAPNYRVEELRTIMISPLCAESGLTSVVHRELLVRLYLEGDGQSISSPRPDPPLLEASADQLRHAIEERDRLIEDLHWALERQRERLVAERSTWPQGEVAKEERVVDWPDLEVTERDETIFRLDEELRWLHKEHAKRYATIEWLHGEVAKRDSFIERLHEEVADRHRAYEELHQELIRRIGPSRPMWWRTARHIAPPWAIRGVRAVRARRRRPRA